MKMTAYNSRIILKISLAVTLELILLASQTSANCRLRNIECKTYDKSFSDFEYCHLKVVNRSYGYMSLRLNIFKLPIKKAKVQWSLYKWANGYKPFLYNITVDACKFMRSRSSFPIVEYFFSLFSTFSNMNHTCPYNHDIIVDKVDNVHLFDKFTKVLPYPTGKYAIYSIWHANDLPRVAVNIFAEMT